MAITTKKYSHNICFAPSHRYLLEKYNYTCRVGDLKTRGEDIMKFLCDLGEVLWYKSPTMRSLYPRIEITGLGLMLSYYRLKKRDYERHLYLRPTFYEKTMSEEKKRSTSNILLSQFSLMYGTLSHSLGEDLPMRIFDTLDYFLLKSRSILFNRTFREYTIFFKSLRVEDLDEHFIQGCLEAINFISDECKS